MMTAFAGLKCARIGAVVNRRLSSLKDASASGFQDHFSVFLVSSVNGRATLE